MANNVAAAFTETPVHLPMDMLSVWPIWYKDSYRGLSLLWHGSLCLLPNSTCAPVVLYDLGKSLSANTVLEIWCLSVKQWAEDNVRLAV